MELGGGAWANDICVKSLRVHCYFQSAIGRPPDEGEYGAGVEELSGYDSMYSHYKSAQLAVHMSRGCCRHASDTPTSWRRVGKKWGGDAVHTRLSSFSACRLWCRGCGLSNAEMLRVANWRF